jgi:very-short-patch-repair endonuclease
MLIIELDGVIHNSDIQVERDIERTKILNQLDLTIIRFSNEEVQNNIALVILKIREKIKDASVKH